MITRSLNACKCASTSTSISPCKHSSNLLSSPIARRRNFNTSSISLKLSTTNDRSNSSSASLDDSKAFQYTAPLWENSSQDKWFMTSVNNDWRWWMKKSQTITTTFTPSTLIKSPALDLASSSSSSTTPNTLVTNLPTYSNNAEFQQIDILIKNYLALREPTHRYLISLSKTNRLGKMAKALEVRKMPLIQRFLLEDLRDMNLKGLNVSMEENGVDEDGEPLPELLKVVDSRVELQSILKQGYRGCALSPILKAERPTLDDIQLLGELWTTFSNTHDFSTSPQDLHLAFSFLTYLVAPISPTHPTAEPPGKYLPLALVVFRNLVDNHISESSVSTPEADSSKGVTLQKVFLRTIVNASLDEGFSHLAYSALDSLASLRESNPSTTAAATNDVDPDLILVQETITSLLNILSAESQDNYRPRLDFDTPFEKAPLTQALTLILTLLPRYSYSAVELSKDTNSHRTISSSTDEILTTFIDEAALRSRWDLVAKCWELWGDGEAGLGYIMPRRRRKLLRWYSGEAPFTTYPRSVNQKLAGTRSIRTVNSRQFSDLAAATFKTAIAGKDRGQISRWSIGEKSDFIELLCNSKAANSRTRDLARRYFKLFLKMNPRGSTHPFSLSGSGLLAIVRSSTVPVDSENRLEFCTTAVNNYISIITSPTSPYSNYSTSSSSTSSTKIAHYDLTILAQCYSLMGDINSVSQVYTKLLQQKIIPDIKDIELIVVALSKSKPKYARKFLILSVELGAKIPFDIYKEIMKATVIHHRLLSTDFSLDLTKVLNIAQNYSGMMKGKKNPKGEEDLRLLEAYANELKVTGSEPYFRKEFSAKESIIGAIGLGETSKFGEVIPSALNPIMKLIAKEDNWSLAITVYDKLTTLPGVLHEGTYRETIKILIRALDLSRKKSLGEPRKDKILFKLRKYTNDLFQTEKPKIKEVKTYEFAFKAAIMLRDLHMMGKLLRYMEEDQFQFPLPTRLEIRRSFLGICTEQGKNPEKIRNALGEYKLLEI